ncbi:MAG: hypothetical protein F6K10_31870 [Moorea sp. SIO2B7]|nr:hypothetical protein [Moorena sp. SIO2B7]
MPSIGYRLFWLCPKNYSARKKDTKPQNYCDNARETSPQNYGAREKHTQPQNYCDDARETSPQNYGAREKHTQPQNYCDNARETSPQNYGAREKHTQPQNYCDDARETSPQNYGAREKHTQPQNYDDDARETSPQNYGALEREISPQNYDAAEREISPQNYDALEKDTQPQNYGALEKDTQPQNYDDDAREISPQNYDALEKDTQPQNYDDDAREISPQNYCDDARETSPQNYSATERETSPQNYDAAEREISPQNYYAREIEKGLLNKRGWEYPREFILENEHLRVTINPETGDLSSIFDKTNQREVLSGAGNQLQAFQDKGQYWDAWNIDPNYSQHPLPPTHLKSIQWLDIGPIRWRIRVIRRLGKSEFCQDYILQTDSPILKIATTVNWQESHVLVKAAFPLNIESDRATSEIPCGAIQRPTLPQTAAEKAKWEIPALHWADLSDDEYGVSLLNDCKYGYDSQPNQLRLTLLRSTCWPNPEADLGIHHFTYALYPHRNTWQSARTVHKGYELNSPLQVLLSDSLESNSPNKLPAVASLLDLQAENLILIAFKLSEDNPQSWILRCYECHGEEANLEFQSNLAVEIASPVDVLERPIKNNEKQNYKEYLPIKPWKIANFVLIS